MRGWCLVQACTAAKNVEEYGVERADVLLMHVLSEAYRRLGPWLLLARVGNGKSEGPQVWRLWLCLQAKEGTSDPRAMTFLAGIASQNQVLHTWSDSPPAHETR
jgi:hypothetical protein